MCENLADPFPIHGVAKSKTLQNAGLTPFLNRIISHHTGQTVETVEKDADRDYYMTADEAKAYGLVDEVVKSRKDLPDAVKEAAKASE